MKSRALASVLVIVTLILASCGGDGNSPKITSDTHEHVFDQRVVSERYLRSEATCRSKNRYYFSCVCGEKGTGTFGDGEKKGHDFSAEIVDEEYFVSDATCEHGKVYHRSCSVCGEESDYAVFYYGESAEHKFNASVPDGQHICTEATATEAAVYYKSCSVCGENGEETFVFGEPLRTYTDAEKEARRPISLSVTLYDAKELIYGFTYNMSSRPLRPVIELESDGFAFEVPASVSEATFYDENDSLGTYYIVKAEAALEAGKTYVYRAYDKYVCVGSPEATLTAVDPSAQTFTFVHVSDTQSSGGVGGGFYGKILTDIVENADFIVHTGDVVEWSKYEHEWTAMLHDNFDKLSKIPVMALAGNHDSTYQSSGNSETFKHFHYRIPDQPTELGFYYSFEYGNVKFIMLNTNRLTGNSLTADQYNWLIGELEDNESFWTVVALHNPLYSPGPWGSAEGRTGITLGLRKQLADVFAGYGVDIVLQGHDHVVSRTHPIGEGGEILKENTEKIGAVSYVTDPGGVIYIESGSGGNHYRGLSSTDKNLYSFLSATSTQYWSEITVDGNKMKVVVKKMDNGTAVPYKAWGIIKNEA